MRPMHSCREVSERASALLDGEVGFFERLQLRLHLRLCSACRRYVQQMSRVAQTLRGLPPAALTPQDETRLLEALERARQERRPD